MATLRSVLAVITGIVFIVAVSIGTDVALAKTLVPTMNSPQAPAATLALALAYRTLYGVAGGWITARLAPSRPMTHAIVLGAVGMSAALAGVVTEWSAGQHWYPIALVVLALPQTWLGAKLVERRAA